MIALVGAPALQADAAVIPEGIYAGERSLGGMEEDDALTAVEEYVAGLAGQQHSGIGSGQTTDGMVCLR